MQKLISLLVAPVLFIGSLFAPTPTPQTQGIPTPAASITTTDGGSPYDIYHVSALEHEKEAYNQANGILGASNVIETPVALFHTSLANAISATANSMTLVSGTTMDGTSLASSTYSFVLDSGTPTQEFVEADCTGTICTNMQRGLSVVTGTTTVASLEQPHRRTATVDIVDAPLILKLASIVNGLSTFPNAILYAPTVTQLENGNQQALASVALVNSVVSTGCANASAGVRGCVDIATPVQAASSTSIGSSGALLVIPSSMATSSNDVPGLHAVITQNSGKIKWNQIDLGTPTTFTALDTFNSGVIVNASSTFTSSVTYSVATSTILKTSSTGLLQAAIAGTDYAPEQLTAGTTTATSTGTASCGNGCSVTINSQPLTILSFPAGTLTASSTIVVDAVGSCSGSQDGSAGWSCGVVLQTGAGTTIWSGSNPGNTNGSFSFHATTVSMGAGSQVSALTGTSGSLQNSSITLPSVTSLRIYATTNAHSGSGEVSSGQATLTGFTVIVQP